MVPVRLMGGLARVFRRVPKVGVPPRTKPLAAPDVSDARAREGAGPPTADVAPPSGQPREPDLVDVVDRLEQDEPTGFPANGDDGRNEATVAPSEPAGAGPSGGEDGNHEAPAGEDGADADASDAKQEEDRANAGGVGGDGGLGAPAPNGRKGRQPESAEAAHGPPTTGSGPSSRPSLGDEGSDRPAPEGNEDRGRGTTPLPSELPAPGDERRSSEPGSEAGGDEPDITPPDDESHARAASPEGDDFPDTPTRESRDHPDHASAEPGPPTVLPARVTTEGLRRSGEPWRFGPRRGRRDLAVGDREQRECAPPELRIRDAGGRWEILLSVDPKAGQSEVLQGGDRLPLARDGVWRVRDFRREIEVNTEDAGMARIPLYTGREPLIFRLAGAGGEGIQRRRMTDIGRYVVIAQKGELHRVGTVFREPEPCDDHRFHAHFFNSSAGKAAETVAGFPEWNNGATTGSASMAGRSLLDSSEDGELFVGKAPTMVSTDGIEWARIGEERDGGWKGQNFLVAEETPGDVLNGACGRFFLRTYRTGQTHLADSRSFRYWPDLERIEVNGQDFDPERILTPYRTGHRKATVRLVGRAGNSLTPDSVHPPRASVSREGTISVPPRATDDELRIGLRRDRWRMEVVVALPRVWWRLPGSRNDWTDTPISFSRQGFRRVENQRLEIRVPDSISSVGARLGKGDHQFFPATRTSASAHRRCDIPLANFADHSALRDNCAKSATILISVAGREVEVIHVRPEQSRRVPRPLPPQRPPHRLDGTGSAALAEAGDQEAAPDDAHPTPTPETSAKRHADAPGARSDGVPFEPGDLVFYPQFGHCDVGAVISDEQTGLDLLELTPRESDGAATRILVPVEQLEKRRIRRSGASPGVIEKILGSDFEPRVEDAVERLDLIEAQERKGTVASLALALKRLHLRRETKVITQEEEKRRVRIRKWLVAEYMAEEDGRTIGRAQSAVTGFLSHAMKAVRAREEAEAIARKRRERAERVEAARNKRALRKATALQKKAESA